MYLKGAKCTKSVQAAQMDWDLHYVPHWYIVGHVVLFCYWLAGPGEGVSYRSRVSLALLQGRRCVYMTGLLTDDLTSERIVLNSDLRFHQSLWNGRARQWRGSCLWPPFSIPPPKKGSEIFVTVNVMRPGSISPFSDMRRGWLGGGRAGAGCSGVWPDPIVTWPFITHPPASNQIAQGPVWQ